MALDLGVTIPQAGIVTPKSQSHGAVGGPLFGLRTWIYFNKRIVASICQEAWMYLYRHTLCKTLFPGIWKCSLKLGLFLGTATSGFAVERCGFPHSSLLFSIAIIICFTLGLIELIYLFMMRPKSK